MGVIKVPTNFNIELEFEIPEFYRRFIALLIDMIIEYFYLRIASEVYSSIRNNSGYFDEGSQHNLWAIGLLLFLPIMIYHVVLEITMNGQSVGKKITGLRVVDENGGKASISQFVIRWLLRLSDLWIVLFFFFLHLIQVFKMQKPFLLLFLDLLFLLLILYWLFLLKKGSALAIFCKNNFNQCKNKRQY